MQGVGEFQVFSWNTETEECRGNIGLRHPKGPYQSWAERALKIYNTIHDAGCSIVCLQEVNKTPQLQVLPPPDWAGVTTHPYCAGPAGLRAIWWDTRVWRLIHKIPTEMTPSATDPKPRLPPSFFRSFAAVILHHKEAKRNLLVVSVHPKGYNLTSEDPKADPELANSLWQLKYAFHFTARIQAHQKLLVGDWNFHSDSKHHGGIIQEAGFTVINGAGPTNFNGHLGEEVELDFGVAKGLTGVSERIDVKLKTGEDEDNGIPRGMEPRISDHAPIKLSLTFQ